MASKTIMRLITFLLFAFLIIGCSTTQEQNLVDSTSDEDYREVIKQSANIHNQGSAVIRISNDYLSKVADADSAQKAEVQVILAAAYMWVGKEAEASEALDQVGADNLFTFPPSWEISKWLGKEKLMMLASLLKLNPQLFAIVIWEQILA